MTKPNKSTEAKPSAAKKSVAVIATIGAAVVGIAGGRLLGAAFWMPLVAIGIAWSLLTKWKVTPWLVPVSAIIIGHTAWIVVGAGILAAMGSSTGEAELYALGEVVVVALLVFWILKRESVTGLGFLIAFEIIGLGAVLMADTRNTMIAVVMHVGLRIAGTVAAIYAIAVARRPSTVATA